MNPLDKDSSVHLIYHDPVISDHWSWSGSSERNAAAHRVTPRPRLRRGLASRPKVVSCAFRSTYCLSNSETDIVCIIAKSLFNSFYSKTSCTFFVARFSVPLLFERERTQLVYEVILLNKLRNHLLSENMQWNYASFNVTLNYLMHEIMEFCATSSLALDNWEQKYCQTIHTLCREEDYFPKGKFKLFDSLFHSVYLAFPKSLLSI